MLKHSMHTVSAGVFLAAAVAASPSFAASVFGTISNGNQPAAGRTIVVECPGRPAVSSRTDAAGSYRVVAAQAGRCTLRVDPPAGPTAPVVMHADGARFDFVLTGGQLRRR